MKVRSRDLSVPIKIKIILQSLVQIFDRAFKIIGCNNKNDAIEKTNRLVETKIE